MMNITPAIAIAGTAALSGGLAYAGTRTISRRDLAVAHLEVSLPLLGILTLVGPGAMAGGVEHVLPRHFRGDGLMGIAYGAALLGTIIGGIHGSRLRASDRAAPAS